MLILLLFCLSTTYAFTSMDINDPVQYSTERVMELAESKVSSFIQQNPLYRFPINFKSRVLKQFEPQVKTSLQSEYNLFIQNEQDHSNGILFQSNAYSGLRRAYLELKETWANVLHRSLDSTLLQKRGDAHMIPAKVPKDHSSFQPSPAKSGHVQQHKKPKIPHESVWWDAEGRHAAKQFLGHPFLRGFVGVYMGIGLIYIVYDLFVKAKVTKSISNAESHEDMEVYK